jgi:hypothetical protein
MVTVANTALMAERPFPRDLAASRARLLAPVEQFK